MNSVQSIAFVPLAAAQADMLGWFAVGLIVGAVVGLTVGLALGRAEQNRSE